MSGERCEVGGAPHTHMELPRPGEERARVPI